jgi:hypothetical protein
MITSIFLKNSKLPEFIKNELYNFTLKAVKEKVTKVEKKYPFQFIDKIKPSETLTIKF